MSILWRVQNAHNWSSRMSEHPTYFRGFMFGFRLATLFSDVLRSQEETRTTSPDLHWPSNSSNWYHVVVLPPPSPALLSPAHPLRTPLTTRRHCHCSSSALCRPQMCLCQCVSGACRAAVPAGAGAGAGRPGSSPPPRCHSHTYANALAYQK